MSTRLYTTLPVMPDHIYLIIQPNLKRYNISQIMKHIKGSFARRYNNLTYKNGPIWQNRKMKKTIL